MKNRGQLIAGDRRDDNMHMIRHHNVFIEMITIPVEMQHRIGNKFFQVRTREDAGTMTGIQPGLNSFGKKPVKFLFFVPVQRFRMRCDPAFLFFLPLFEF